MHTTALRFRDFRPLSAPGQPLVQPFVQGAATAGCAASVAAASATKPSAIDLSDVADVADVARKRPRSPETPGLRASQPSCVRRRYDRSGATTRLAGGAPPPIDDGVDALARRAPSPESMAGAVSVANLDVDSDVDSDVDLESDTGHRSKARSDARDEHLPPLLRAARDNSINTVAQLIADGSDLDAVDEHGNTMLHLAAERRNLRIIQMLCRAGAKTSVSNDRGLLPVHLAADEGYDGAVKFLLDADSANSSSSSSSGGSSRGAVEPRWKRVSELAAAFDKALREGGTLTDERIDRITADLTGETRSMLNDEMRLFKYVSHLRAWKGVTLGAKHEGWNAAEFLPLRIRSLVALITKLRTDPRLALPAAVAAAAGGGGGGGGRDRDALAARLTEELATDLDTLRLARRFRALRHIEDEAICGQALNQEAERIFARASRLRAGEEDCLPLGFPGHVLYVGLTRQRAGNARGLTLRIDNLGDGFRRTHASQAERIVDPVVVFIPEAFLTSARGAAAVQGLLVNLLQHEISPVGDWDRFYADVMSFQDTLTRWCEQAGVAPAQQLGGNTPALRPLKRYKQVAGNCVVENHSASLAARLGEATQRFLAAFEVDSTLARPENLVSQELFRKKEKAKHEHILADILDDETPDADLLRSFFDEPEHDRVGESVDAQTLKALLKKNAVPVLDLLFAHGAGVDSRDDKERSLLRRAVDAGNEPATRVLLAHRASVDAADLEGVTPLHRAADLGNEALARLLLDAGADPNRPDKAGRTASSIAAARVATSTRLASTLATAASQRRPIIQDQDRSCGGAADATIDARHVSMRPGRHHHHPHHHPYHHPCCEPG